MLQLSGFGFVLCFLAVFWKLGLLFVVWGFIDMGMKSLTLPRWVCRILKGISKGFGLVLVFCFIYRRMGWLWLILGVLEKGFRREGICSCNAQSGLMWQIRV